MENQAILPILGIWGLTKPMTRHNWKILDSPKLQVTTIVIQHRHIESFFSLVTNLQDDKKLYLSSKYQNKYEGIFTISGNILPTLWWNATDGEVRFRQ